MFLFSKGPPKELLHDIGLDNDFLDVTPKLRQQKQKDKWYYLKLKSLVTVNNRQSEKAICWMGENIYKSRIW